MRCKVASNETLHGRGKRAFSGKCRTIAAPLWGQSVRKFYWPEDFMVPRSCDTRFHYEAEMFHLRMRRWSVER